MNKGRNERVVSASAGRTAPKPDSRRPYHVAVAIGVCAGVYAGSLTAVTILQVNHDRALARERAPVAEAIDLLGRHNDRMAREIDRADSTFARAAAGYDGIAQSVLDVDSSIERLSLRVAEIKGSAMRIPDSLALPKVSRVSSGRSGGSSGSSSTTTPPSKTAPPPTQGTTGASGG
jgi:hypothetical protein